MATDLSNAQGTALYYMPTAHLQDTSQTGLGVTTAKLTSDNSAQLEIANNIAKIGIALGDGDVSAEKLKQAQGQIAAINFMNSQDPEDIKRKSVIALAQDAGVVKPADNPYFTAYADKIRGSLLGAQYARDYQELYVNNPAGSPDAEKQRWQQYIQAKYGELQSNPEATPIMTSAFQMGFGEHAIDTMNKLADTQAQKDITDKTTALLYGSRTALGNLSDNMETILQTNGALTNGVQQVVDNMRTAGVDFGTTSKVLTDWIDAAVKTGQLPPDRAQQLVDSIALVRDKAGNPAIKMSDIVSGDDIHDEAGAYFASTLTQERMDFLVRHIKDNDTSAAYAEIEQAPQWKRKGLYELMGQIYNGQEARKAREEAKKLAIANKTAKAASDAASLETNVQAFLAGNPGAGLQDFPEELKVNYMTQKIGGIMADTSLSPADKMDSIARYYTFPKFKSIKDTISGNYETFLDNVKAYDDGTVEDTGGNALNLVQMYEANPRAFTSAFTGNLVSKVSTIAHMSEMSSDDDGYGGLRLYAKYRSLDTETKNAVEGNIKNTVEANNPQYSSGYDVHFAVYNADGSGETIFSVNDSKVARYQKALEMMATIEVASGAADYDTGIQDACLSIQRGLQQYKGMILPTSEADLTDEAFKNTLNIYALGVAQDKGLGWDDLTMSYNPDNRTIYITTPNGNGSVTITDLYNMTYGG